MVKEVHVDNVVFGGGVAGLWILNQLNDGGSETFLVEKDKLGRGQTIGSQGTVYGGVKYAVGAAFREDSVEEIKGMPARWVEHMKGLREPDLSGVDKKSDILNLWIPKGRKIQSFIFSKKGVDMLESKPVELSRDEYPEWLSESAEIAYKVQDPVVETKSLLAELAKKYSDKIVYSDQNEMEVSFDDQKKVNKIYFPDNDLIIYPKTVILTAGVGNSGLARKMGIDEEVVQERPLRQVVVKGKNLPEFYGHCIDILGIAKNVMGTKDSFPTVATITTHPDGEGGYVWNVGGRVAEEGVGKDPETLERDSREELSRILKGVDFSECEFSYFDAVRAELRTKDGSRPGGSTIYRDRNVYVCFPTKLSLAPSLADKIEKMILGANKENVKVSEYPWQA